MSRPKTKEELIELSNKNFKDLNSFIDGFSDAEKETEFPQGTMNRNFRDVLAHLHHWHLMMLEWYQAGMTGAKPDMPAQGYTWKDTPKLNRKIWKNYQSISLREARQLLKESHLEIEKIMWKHSNEELFEKKRYSWTGTTSLGAYLISASSSHYEWALKLVKKAKKNSNT
jgi:hypothetical protein